MKTIKNIVFIVLIISIYSENTFAQLDSIYANVQGDTVTIWHNQTFRNCASRFLIEYEINDFQIKILEVDTVGPIANCLCYYDLSIGIGHLPTGKYTVEIFGTDTLVIDTTYLGSTSFEIVNSVSNQAFKFYQSQSDCYELTSVTNKSKVLPDDYELLSVYPNPFNPETNIEFYLSKRTQVKIAIYDNNGRELETLLSKEFDKGNHRIIWDAKKYSSGVYYVTMSIRNKTKTQKALFIK